jgi:hypothetical protein
VQPNPAEKLYTYSFFSIKDDNGTFDRVYSKGTTENVLIIPEGLGADGRT